MTLTVQHKGEVKRSFPVEPGTNLRKVLLEQDCSPYRGAFVKLNCGGLGICGSCIVEVLKGEIWQRQRACQTRVYKNLEIRTL